MFDDRIRLDFLKATAEQGDANAQFVLGYKYDTGEDVPQNDTEAARWYRKAAEQGFDVALSVTSMTTVKASSRTTLRRRAGIARLGRAGV